MICHLDFLNEGGGQTNQHLHKKAFHIFDIGKAVSNKIGHKEVSLPIYCFNILILKVYVFQL